MAATRMKQMQRIANRYFEAHEDKEASTHEMAAWAIDNDFWQPARFSLINQCAAQMAEAMRQEFIRDPQGRTIRAKHAARVLRDGQQLVLWADIRSRKREHMEIAFKQRRKQIVGDCCQLKRDNDSFNENYNDGRPIDIPFDFTPDVQEAEMGAKVEV